MDVSSNHSVKFVHLIESCNITQYISYQVKYFILQAVPQISMSSFWHDLRNSSFVKSPLITLSALYEQYVNDISDLLNKHAPLLTCTFTKESTGWLSDSYQRARTLKQMRVLGAETRSP